MIKITDLKIEKDNEEGKVYGFSVAGIRKSSAQDFLLIKRKKGTVCGEHYHTGKIAEKNPEIIVLLEGRIELYCKNMKTGEELRKAITAPCRMEFPPFVWHEIKAITEIILLEFNSLEQHREDTVKEKKRQLI